jgi:hypothetical protein
MDILWPSERWIVWMMMNFAMLSSSSRNRPANPGSKGETSLELHNIFWGTCPAFSFPALGAARVAPLHTPGLPVTYIAEATNVMVNLNRGWNPPKDHADTRVYRMYSPVFHSRLCETLSPAG